jgi:hypothetical protein
MDYSQLQAKVSTSAFMVEAWQDHVEPVLELYPNAPQICRGLVEQVLFGKQRCGRGRSDMGVHSLMTHMLHSLRLIIKSCPCISQDELGLREGPGSGMRRARLWVCTSHLHGHQSATQFTDFDCLYSEAGVWHWGWVWLPQP